VVGLDNIEFSEFLKLMELVENNLAKDPGTENAGANF
jgi:hypothetical protein